ncbi:uncharacterized protein LOC134702148 [Mytilus trossulus]|uniref:uncharacterized protein LOC134702148 n=1 Tax=Mytilus trossulus TaxID=6551 RepID=UPI003003FFF0
MMKSAVLIWFIQVIAVTFVYELKCPAPGYWRLRARKFYCGQSYMCLLRSPENSYRETCDGLDYSSTGSKLIFEPYFNKAGCSSKRYQPFPFSTDGNNKCVYQTSFCNEEGQIVHREGSMINDTTCGCDSSQGYTFITTPKHNCYCIPSEEDCSCYKLICDNEDNPCPFNHVIGTAVRNKSCQEIIVRPSQHINFSSLFEHRFKDVRNDYNEGRTNKLNCIYFAVAVVIVLTICLPSYALSQWPDAVYKVRSFECIVDHLKFIKVLTDEETAEIQIQTTHKKKNRKLMEILLNGGEDHYDKFIEALNAFKEYKYLANQIKNTEVTPDDKELFHNCIERSD